MKTFMKTSHNWFTRTLSVFGLSFILFGCQINFNADLYSSDLISLGNHPEEQSVSLPMTIEFQVASCDDLSTQNRIFSTYFSEYSSSN